VQSLSSSERSVLLVHWPRFGGLARFGIEAAYGCEMNTNLTSFLIHYTIFPPPFPFPFQQSIVLIFAFSSLPLPLIPTMQLTSILLLAIHAAAICGWKIPKGQGDGVYRVDANDDGTFNHTLLSPPTISYAQSSLARAPGTPISRIQRDLTFPETTTCLTYSLVAANNNNAFNALSAMCHGTPSLTSLGMYSVSGDAVVYWCNYPTQACTDCSTLGQSCSPEDLSISIQTFLSGTCGSFVAGWTSWTRESYGQESVSRDPGFCGNGLFHG
jgi:hypothetical protein